MTQRSKLCKDGIYTQIIIPITQRKQLQCKDVNDNCTIMPITIDKIAQRRNLCKNDNFKKDGNYSKTKTMQRQKLYKDGNYAKTTFAIFLFTLLSWDPFIRIFFKHMPSPTGTVLSTMKHVSCRRKQLESIENFIMYFLNTLVNLGRFVRGWISLYYHCKLKLDNIHPVPLKIDLKKNFSKIILYKLDFELQHYYTLLI